MRPRLAPHTPRLVNSRDSINPTSPASTTAHHGALVSRRRPVAAPVAPHGPDSPSDYAPVQSPLRLLKPSKPLRPRRPRLSPLLSFIAGKLVRGSVACGRRASFNVRTVRQPMACHGPSCVYPRAPSAAFSPGHWLCLSSRPRRNEVILGISHGPAITAAGRRRTAR